MGGWNILYNLINFAILGAGVYLVGKKTVVKMFGGRRDKIAEDLEKSSQSAENAKTAPEQIAAAKAAGEKERTEILSTAQATAEANRQEAEEADQLNAARLMDDAAKEANYRKRALRGEMNEIAAEKITAAAAELLWQPERAK